MRSLPSSSTSSVLRVLSSQKRKKAEEGEFEKVKGMEVFEGGVNYNQLQIVFKDESNVNDTKIFVLHDIFRLTTPDGTQWMWVVVLAIAPLPINGIGKNGSTNNEEAF